VTTQVFEEVDQVRHVTLARLADAIVIAPATADLIARIAQGRADDLLTNVILASDVPILIVPAMHPNMWFNSATQANIKTLRDRGFDVLEPVEGALTSGDVGKGRFPATHQIMERFTGHTLAPQDLTGKKVIVTAGGTREAIDPVRFIGNLSTGKQGIAIAEAAAQRGAQVTLIIANSELPAHADITRVDVQSVAQMRSALDSVFTNADILFMAAAISDARPANSADQKIKKRDLRSIELIENPDLLAALAANKSQQFLVAFAAETENEGIEIAQEKMRRKGADLIYLNNVSGGAIFGSSHTSGSLIDETGVIESFTEISKENLAHSLINHVIQRAHQLG
jgi:phosphopantothenoylcysteine decarboxylase/phosphopantothenate--cysteine ligase